MSQVVSESPPKTHRMRLNPQTRLLSRLWGFTRGANGWSKPQGTVQQFMKVFGHSRVTSEQLEEYRQCAEEGFFQGQLIRAAFAPPPDPQLVN